MPRIRRRRAGGRVPINRTRLGIALGVVLLVALGAYGAVSYFNSRDDATVSSSQGPGRARGAGERPVVQAGNVLLLYSDPQLAGPLRALQRELSGTEASASLAAAGQAVIVRRQTSLPVPVAALSARHRLDGSREQLPALRDFVEYWLGRDRG